MRPWAWCSKLGVGYKGRKYPQGHEKAHDQLFLPGHPASILPTGNHAPRRRWGGTTSPGPLKGPSWCFPASPQSFTSLLISVTPDLQAPINGPIQNAAWFLYSHVVRIHRQFILGKGKSELSALCGSPPAPTAPTMLPAQHPRRCARQWPPEGSASPPLAPTARRCHPKLGLEIALQGFQKHFLRLHPCFGECFPETAAPSRICSGPRVKD